MASQQTLRDEFDAIEFSIGDVIIEVTTGNVGFLKKRERRVDIEMDDMYFWEVHWSDESLVPVFETFSQFRTLEEEYLKISIIIGIIVWQSINQKELS